MRTVELRNDLHRCICIEDNRHDYDAVFGYFYSFDLKNKHNMFKLILLIVLIVIFFNFTSESTVGEKFQFESLYSNFYRTISEGNLLFLWEWEGNSRQIIIADAFVNFDFGQWI